MFSSPLKNQPHASHSLIHLFLLAPRCGPLRHSYGASGASHYDPRGHSYAVGGDPTLLIAEDSRTRAEIKKRKQNPPPPCREEESDTNLLYNDDLTSWQGKSRTWETAGNVKFVFDATISDGFLAHLHAGCRIWQKVTGLKCGQSYALSWRERCSSPKLSLQVFLSQGEVKSVAALHEVASNWEEHKEIFTASTETVCIVFDAPPNITDGVVFLGALHLQGNSPSTGPLVCSL